MFNAISLQKVREIVYDLFPDLENFADCLYDDDGTTCIKQDDGTWTEIPVCEGFSQGCPLSPVLSAIVLNYILTEVDFVLQQISELRRRQAYSFSDDNLGGRAIIMTYVNDVNFLVPYSDVEILLETFDDSDYEHRHHDL